MADWGFWAAALLMAATVMTVLVGALRRGTAEAGAASVDLAVYKDQLADVERDLARGTLAAEDAARLRAEIGRRVLDLDKTAAPVGARGQVRVLPVALVLGLVVLGGAAGTYWRLGAPGYPDLPLAKRLALADETYRTRPKQLDAEAVAPPETVADLDPEFLDLMAKLRTAIADRPDDQEGLILLARNETMLGNYKAARAAQEHLVTLLADKATATDHMVLAQAMIAAAGGYVSPEAEAQLTLVLELEPRNPLARYFSGLMFVQNGRPDRTFALWEPLLSEGPADAPWMQPIQSALADVADRAGIKYRPAEAPAEMGAGPTEADMAAASQMTPAERQEMIKGMVAQLETRLTDQGGPLQDWLKLINAVSVLGDPDRAKAAVAAANAAFAGQPEPLAAIASAATAAGIAP